MTRAKTIIDGLVAARRDGAIYELHGEELDAVVAMLRHAAAPLPAVMDDPATTLLDTLVTVEGLEIPVKLAPERIGALIGVLEVSRVTLQVLEPTANDSPAKHVVLPALTAGRDAGLWP